MLALLITLVLCTLIGTALYQFSNLLVASLGIAITIFIISKVTYKIMEDQRMFWVLRGCIFTSVYAKIGDETFDSRVNYFTERVAAALESDEYDKVLLIGHSMGCVPVPIVLAQLITQHPDLPFEKLSALTMGQIILLLSLLPEATEYREILKTVASSNKIHWVDYSAPADSVCFALASPFTEIEEEAIKRPIILRSPRFHVMFPKDVYRKISRNKFQFHFQYIMSVQIPAKFDYFYITANATIPE